MTTAQTVQIGSHEIAIYGWTLGGKRQPVSAWPITPAELEQRAEAKTREYGMQPEQIARADAIWMLTTGIGQIDGMHWSHDDSTKTRRELRDHAEAVLVENIDAGAGPLDRV